MSRRGGSAFRLDAEGFVRIVVIDRGISEERLARLLQRRRLSHAGDDGAAAGALCHERSLGDSSRS